MDMLLKTTQFSTNKLNYQHDKTVTLPKKKQMESCKQVYVNKWMCKVWVFLDCIYNYMQVVFVQARNRWTAN